MPDVPVDGLIYKNDQVSEWLYAKKIRTLEVQAVVYSEFVSCTLTVDQKIFTAFRLDVSLSTTLGNVLDLCLAYVRSTQTFTEGEVIRNFHLWTYKSSNAVPDAPGDSLFTYRKLSIRAVSR